MNPTLLIDASHLFYPLVFKMPSLAADEVPTGILFGMTGKTIQLIKKFQTNQVVWIFDSRKNYRKKIFPEYKVKRKDKNKEKTPEEIAIWDESLAQLNQFRRETLPSLGFKNNFIQTGFESDDIIASITINNPDKKFVIVANDEDLFQLLTDNVSIYNSKTGKTYTKKDFVEEWGIQPEQWVDVKAIGGCNSDEVPGVAGVAAKTVAKYLRGELKETGKKYQDIVSEEGKKIAEFNRPLVELPFEGTEVFKLTENWKLNIRDFITTCETYRFNSLMYSNSYDVWKEIMCEGE